MKDHRPGLLADFEDGFNRWIIAIEPGMDGKPCLAIESYEITLDGLQHGHRTTRPAAAALELAAGIQSKLGDNA